MDPHKPFQSRQGKDNNVNLCLINPLLLIGNLIGILILTPLKGGGVINHGSALTDIPTLQTGMCTHRTDLESSKEP